MRESLGRIAAILRGAGDALQRQFGPAALEVLYEALDDAEREVERVFNVSQNGHFDDPGEPLDPPDAA